MTPTTRPGEMKSSVERRFQLMVELVTDYAIYLLDPNGFVASWNAGAAKITGYTAAEVLGQHFSRFFTEDDQGQGLPLKTLELARSEGRYETEGWRLRKDGGRFWALSVLETVSDETGMLIGFAEITRDMTERHASQMALEESERRFRLLVQGVVDYSMFMLDPSGLVVNWNAGAERIKGYTRKKSSAIISASSTRRRIAPQVYRSAPSRPPRTKAVSKAKAGASARTAAASGRRSSWMRSATKPAKLLGFAKITRDITERLAAQQALERQRTAVPSAGRQALPTTPCSCWIRMAWWSAGIRAREDQGLQADEIIGQHFSRFYTEQDRAAGMPARALFTATSEGRFEAEGWRMRKDGSMFWANVVIDAIRDDDGRLVGFAKITRDITERREAQQALQRAHEKLAHAQKMEALGQLTGGIAHDFNNLLTIVGGQAQILKRQLEDNPKALRAAEAIESAAQRGESLTRRLLAFSRRQYLRPELIDLRTLADLLRTMLSTSLTASIQLVIMVGDALWPVHADPNELELALVNLAINARDAMPQGGMLSVMAENVTLHPGDRKVELSGDFVALTVADTGTGIPEDVLPKVFDPFFTTKPVDKGTGLGLSQVYGFVHQTGGSVAIDSRIGRGTRVTLFLPRATHAAMHAAAGDGEPTAGNKRILLVEDNPDVASVTIDMLDELGHQSVLVPNAEAALQTLEQQADFDLLFSDIVMAGMGGIELANVVRERYPDMPILLTSGYTKSIETAHLHWPLLRKPFKLAELNRALANVVAQRNNGKDPKLVHLTEARKHRASKGGSGR